MGLSTLLKPPEEDKLDGMVLLGFTEKKSPSKIEMVDFWTFRLKTTSKQVAGSQLFVAKFFTSNRTSVDCHSAIKLLYGI